MGGQSPQSKLGDGAAAIPQTRPVGLKSCACIYRAMQKLGVNDRREL
jgi:hypothetical protein